MAEHAELLDLNRRLLGLRHTYPDLTDPQFDHSVARSERRRALADIERGAMVLVVNFGADRPRWTCRRSWSPC